MALDGREFTITVQQSYPSAGAVTSPTGGAWPAGIFSFKVAAVYWSSDTLESDHGVIRTNVANWAGHPVTANDNVTITWTAAERPPDHYSVYYIENVSWTADGTLRGRKIAEVNGDILTATISKPYLQRGACTGTTSTTILKDTAATFVTNGVEAGHYVILNAGGEYAKVVTVDSETQLTTQALTDSGTYDTGEAYDVVYHIMPYDADAKTFTINPIKDVPLQVRQTMVRAYQGRLVAKSYALGSPLDAIDIEFYNSSITMTNYHWLQIFIYHTTRCRITESSGADALITPMDGYFTNCSFLGSKHKNSRPVHSVRFECELGTLT